MFGPVRGASAHGRRPRPSVMFRAVTGSRRQMSDEAVREILTAEQAADLLQVSMRTVLQLARDGELLGHKVGRAWRFCRTDVLAYVRVGRLVGSG
jgi:excisionase family DNA binding protein